MQRVQRIAAVLEELGGIEACPPALDQEVVRIAKAIGARDLEFRTFEGEELAAKDLLGRIVLVDFWATWCAPCLEELPNLRRIHEELASRGVLILGVSVDQTSDRAQLRTWLRRNEIEWPQVWDNRGVDGQLAKRFGVEAVPRTVVIDRAGRMVAVDLRGDALYTVLRDLGRASSVSE